MSHCGVTQKKPKPMKYLKDTFGKVDAQCSCKANVWEATTLSLCDNTGNQKQAKLENIAVEVENCHSLANKNNQNAGAAGDLAQQLDEVML